MLSDKKESRKKLIFCVTAPLGFVLLFVLSLLLGSSAARFGEAVSALFRGDFSNTAYRIVFYIRLPRALGGALAGAALATSGVILQAVLNNPMVAPNIIGVNAGAGFLAILVVALAPWLLKFMPLFAFLGALLSALLIYGIARITGAGRLTITLVGVAIGSILTAGINTVKTLFPDAVYDMNEFMVGGLSGVGYNTLFPAGYIIIATLPIAFLTYRFADMLSMGEDTASSLGLNVGRANFLLLLIAALLAGAAVSYAGLLGFLGLIVPHIARILVGGGHKRLLPAAALLGGGALLFADLVSRLIFAPYELPVGILLSLVGGPFFIILILLRRRGSL